MEADPLIAFVVRSPEAPALEIRVNFGVFAGRAATPAEIDELARVLLAEVDAVAIVSEERHEIDTHAEASLHQVRIEVPSDVLPASEDEVEKLGERLAAEASDWAQACIAERHAEVSEL